MTWSSSPVLSDLAMQHRRNRWLELDCSFFLAMGRFDNIVERRLKRSPLIYHFEGLSFDLWSELFDDEINRDTKCVQIGDCFQTPPIALNLWG